MTRTAVAWTSVAVLAASFSVAAGPAAARPHRHWHRFYVPDVDASYGNLSAPDTTIYPAADWSFFFHRVRHYGPVLYLPPAAFEPAPSATADSPPISALD